MRAYPLNQVPPPDAGAVMWRGRVTAEAPPCPANSAYGHLGGPCLAGWVPADGRWLHCGTCRPWEGCGHDHHPGTVPEGVEAVAGHG